MNTAAHPTPTTPQTARRPLLKRVTIVRSPTDRPAPRRRSRPATALTWAIGAFAALQLALLAVMEWRCPGLRDPEFGARLTLLRERIAAEPDRPLVLLLGSSRTELGLRPSALPERERRPLVFNFGLSGSGPVEELITLRRLLAAGVRPRQVLLEVLPPAFAERSAESFDDYALLQRLGWSDLSAVTDRAARPAHVRTRWLADNAVPCWSHRVELRRLAGLEPAYPAAERDGWLSVPPPSDAVEAARRRQHTHAQYAAALTAFRPGSLPFGALTEALDLCRTHEVASGLYCMPEDAAFRAWYAPTGRAAFDRALSALCRQRDLPYLDASVALADTDFGDGHHLLPGAATRLTRGPFAQWLQSLTDARVADASW